jgi:dTDP-4-dehydrorhamnose 3,5-epimerase
VVVKFVRQKLQGVYVIEPEPFTDERGLFRRHFCRRELGEHGIDIEVKQANVSENPALHTLRGLHFQRPPFGESKILSCMKGGIYNVIVDLRADSPTYLQWMTAELSDQNRLSVYVPRGCANGWMTLHDGTWVHYYHSEFYQPSAEGGIRYNDPFFRFVWPAEPAVISEKDRTYPDFERARA